MVLKSMKIGSFCHDLQGPAAMQYLSDMGAEVIKIEPPGGAYDYALSSVVAELC